MFDWFLDTGMSLLVVALIPAVGLLLICWGLRGDRSRARARCPGCWCDMRRSLPALDVLAGPASWQLRRDVSWSAASRGDTGILPRDWGFPWYQLRVFPSGIQGYPD